MSQRVQHSIIFICFLSVLVISVPAYSDPPGKIDRSSRSAERVHHPDDAGTEIGVSVEYFNVGDARSVGPSGAAEVGTSAVLVETEYEKNYWTFSFNYERWNYSWKNPERLPFLNGQRIDPWSTFTTFQLGIEYEQVVNPKWEIYYYVEAESSYEKEASNSNEYEIGIDFNYEASKAWIYTLNLNWEYLDAEGGEFGVDFEVEWNHDRAHSNERGWSGEFEISSEFPESSVTYHFGGPWAATLFLGDNGTNTIRLANNSPTGFQRGYLEDEYNSYGLRLSYQFFHGTYLSFSVQRNVNRQLAFVDANGGREASYSLGDTTQATLMFSYEFSSSPHH